ncbi:MAG: LacI family transcriptional regulator [Candidatus Omnitrophica bacterium]|nr:LacI family transcriptional regulator [Candidatus Omnitrophota bacterium]
MKTTIKDIARQVGVSQTTVSLAFRENSRISAATRQQVLEVANRLNYTPNLTARHLRCGKTRSIGMLVNDITNPFYALMVRAAAKTVARHGYELLITDSQWNPDKEIRELKKLIESRVEGILACFCEKTDEGFTLLERYNVPFLALDTYPKGFKGPFVANDLIDTGRLAAEHLAEAGCRHPVFFTAEQEMAHFSSFLIIEREFGRILNERGIEFDAGHVISAGLTIASGLEALMKLWKKDRTVDGIFCANSLCALGVIEAGDRLGIKVGRDLAVMGIDDLDICELSRISLTAIRQLYGQLTEMAATSLIDCLREKRPLTVRLSLKPELIVRESSRLKINHAKSRLVAPNISSILDPERVTASGKV